MMLLSVAAGKRQTHTCPTPRPMLNAHADVIACTPNGVSLMSPLAAWLPNLPSSSRTDLRGSASIPVRTIN